MDVTMGSVICGTSTLGGSVLNGSVAVSQSVSAIRSRSSTSPTRTCQQRILAAGSSERLLATVSPTPHEAGGFGLSSSSSSLGRCSFLVDSQTQLNGGFHYYNRKVSSTGSGRITHRHHTAGSLELGESRLRSKSDAPGKLKQRSEVVGGSEGNVGRGTANGWSASNLNGSLREEEREELDESSSDVA